MKISYLTVAMAMLALAGCSKAEAPAGGGSTDGRYQGVGIYSPSRLWGKIVAPDGPTDTAAAKLDDDDEIIVVVDSQTGEIRQCGNLSGFCIGMNPWAADLPAAQHAPIPLTEHGVMAEQPALAPVPVTK